MLLASPLLAAGRDPAGRGAAAPSGDLFSAAGLISLLTLVALEVVLGIDNVIFIAILAGRLPASEQAEGAQARHRDGGDLAASAAAQHLLGDAADRAAVHHRQRGRSPASS